MIELLQIYYDEWKFRQESLWKRLIQFFVIIFFVTTLPVTINAFGKITLPAIPLVVFPILGIALSLFFTLFFLCEAARINAVNRKVYTIIEDNYDKKYLKSSLPPFSKKRELEGKDAWKLLQGRMSIWVPVTLAIMQIGLAIAEIALIESGSIL